MSAPPSRKIRFGVMCRGDQMEAAFADCIRQLTAIPDVELALIIVDADPPVRSTRKERLRKLLTFSGGLWALFQRISPMRKLPCYRHTDLSELFSKVPRLECTTLRKGRFSQYFREEDVESIRKHNLDFILRFAFGIVRGEILRTARYGVWSFHHDDELKFRGGPPGFWEIYQGEPTTAAILQRLTDRLDGGVVLQKCHVRTRNHSHGANLNAVVWASTYMPARVVRDLLHGCGQYVDAAPSHTSAPIYRSANDYQMLRFMIKTAGAWVRSQLEGLFFAEHWNVGLVHEPISRFLEPGFQPQIRWLPLAKKNGFFADPFLMGREDDFLLLMEEFDDHTHRGVIVGTSLGPDGALRHPPVVVLDEGMHMAYPHVFHHEGQTYCTPESYQKRCVCLYRLDTRKNEWVEEAHLLQNFAAVDPTVFRHEGRWWLFCTNREDEVESKLFLWYADELKGPWTPHPSNPVKVDVRSSRPGGNLFVDRGSLYRPAQNSSVTYGGGITINRVDALSPVEFREEEVASLKPWAGSRYSSGTHTLSGSGGCTVVDGKRMRFASALLLPRLLHKMRGLLRSVL